jgi:hypothetical protein
MLVQKDLKESGRSLIEVLPQHIPRGTGENRGKPKSGQSVLGQNTNKASPVCKHNTLPLGQLVQSCNSYRHIRQWSHSSTHC